MKAGARFFARHWLALSMVTGRPLRIQNIRAGRRKPGLMRQHLTAGSTTLVLQTISPGTDARRSDQHDLAGGRHPQSVCVPLRLPGQDVSAHPGIIDGAFGHRDPPTSRRLSGRWRAPQRQDRAGGQAMPHHTGSAQPDPPTGGHGDRRCTEPSRSCSRQQRGHLVGWSLYRS